MACCAEDLGLVLAVDFGRELGGGALTSHTRGLGGFCGLGGSVVEGRFSVGSRGAGEVAPLGDVSIVCWLWREEWEW